MIRSMWVGVAAVLCFASTVTARPSIAAPERALRECQLVPTASMVQPKIDSARVTDSPAPPPCSFGDLKLRIGPGESVYVVDASGRETRGRVMTLSDAILTVTIDAVRREFRAADVKQIDRRRRDPVWNGVLIGAAAGSLAGFGLGRSLDSPSCPRPAIECGQGAIIGTVGGALWGAAGGWIADALIRKREVVYDRAPAAGRR